ncbi:MAG: thioredoxin fold domain-containing protein [Rhizobium sp.]|nr:thioredoxin fold domain-containing protein [Rhizobium sp.]
MIRRSLLALALVATMTACAAEPQATAAPAKAAAATPAGDAAIREALLGLAPGMEIGQISDSPIPGFREVAVGARVVYVSNDGKRLIQGALIDIASRENLTQASEAGLRQGLLASVGDDSRITFAAKQPRHEITVFTDIDCGYCRRLHSEIAEYNRLGITVNYLFYPRTGLGSESFDKAVSVWCAPDRRQAMTEAKAGKALPKADCTNPVTRDYDLGRRIGLDGTPAIYAADGTQLGGYVAPAEMLARLDEIAAKTAR